MTISRELFLSLLAMDAYNRGYSSGIEGLFDDDGTQLGSASVIDREKGTAAQAVGFYAIAYEVGGGVDGIAEGTKVISYRGTDAAVDVVTARVARINQSEEM